MAEQNPPVVATGEEEGKWFIDTAKQAVWNVVDFAQDKWWDVVDFLQEAGWAALGAAWEIVEDISESLFKQNDTVQIEKSKVITQDFLNEAKTIWETWVWESFKDMFTWVKSSYDPTVDKDIKDIETFNQMQELRKVFNDSLAWVAKQYQILEKKENKTNDDFAELRRLEAVQSSLQTEYTNNENALISIAIKWNTEEEKRAKLNTINQQLDKGWAATNEWQVELKHSLESDEFLDWVIRDKATDLTWTIITWDNVESIRAKLSADLANTKTNRVRALNSAIESWMSTEKAEALVKDFNKFEALQEDYIKATMEWVYAWLAWKELVNAVAVTMWDEAVNEMIELENNLTSDVLVATWKSNFFWDHKFIWALQLSAWATAKALTWIKNIKNALVWATEEDLLKRDASELMTFNKTWLQKWLTWALYNMDDIILNIGWVVATSYSWQMPFNLAWKAVALSPRTLALYNKYNAYADKSWLAKFLLKNKYVWAGNLLSNVTTWLIPNILIDTAAKDVTSESRILFGMLNDVMFWPVFDSILWGWARVFSRAVKTFGWVPESTIVKNLADQFKLPEKDAAELYDALSTWRTITWIELPTEKSQIDLLNLY